MNCQKCKSDRIVSLNSKCSDQCDISLGENEHTGYVLGDFGIGSGDYISFEYCADCGQIQGDFPLQPTSLEVVNEDNEETDSDE